MYLTFFLETVYDFPDKTDQHASCNVSMTSLFEVILWLQSLLFMKIVSTFLMWEKQIATKLFMTHWFPAETPNLTSACTLYLF